MLMSIENLRRPNQHIPSGACPIVEKNGFLKRICAEVEGYQSPMAILQCTHSDVQYISIFDLNVFTRVCENDPHFYQRCGAGKERLLQFSNAMCGDFICNPVGDNFSLMHFISPDIVCGRSPCGQYCSSCSNLPISETFCSIDDKSDTEAKVQLRSGLNVSKSAVCNGRCDVHYYCEDEAWCDGYLYGMYCTHWRLNTTAYVKPAEVCDQISYHVCKNNEDERHCPELHSLPSNERCFSDKYSDSHPKEVIILNSTRCGPPWEYRGEDQDPRDAFKWNPLCINGQDQTNCTDRDR